LSCCRNSTSQKASSRFVVELSIRTAIYPLGRSKWLEKSLPHKQRSPEARAQIIDTSGTNLSVLNMKQKLDCIGVKEQCWTKNSRYELRASWRNYLPAGIEIFFKSSRDCTRLSFGCSPRGRIARRIFNVPDE